MDKYGFSLPTLNTVTDQSDKYGFSINNIPKPKSNILPNTQQAFSDLMADPFSFKANPAKAIGDAWNTIKDSVSQEAENIKNVFKVKLTDKNSTAKFAGAQLKVLSGGAGVMFSPISALFSAANDIPVLGSASKLIGLAFGAAGEGASQISGGLIDKLPVSQETKDALKPGVQEIFSLAAQLALGNVVDVGIRGVKGDSATATTFKADYLKANPDHVDVVSKIPDNIINKLVQDRGAEDAKTIINQSIKLSELKKTEPVSPTDTISKPPKVIPTGEVKPLAQEAGKYKSAEEFVKAQGENQAVDNYLNTNFAKDEKGYFDYRNGVRENLTPKELDYWKKVAVDEFNGLKKAGGTPKAESQLTDIFNQSKAVGEVKPTIEQKPSGIALKISKEALQEKLIKQSAEIDTLAGYDPKTFVGQDEIIAKFILNNLEKAKEIIRGKASLPADMSGSRFLRMMKNKARAEIDVATIKDLANSPLVSATSVHAQEMGFLRGFDREDPVQAIKELADIKKAKVKKDVQANTKEVNEVVDKAIRKGYPKKQTLLEFINSLKC
jgi:hypothetical protein